jgi:hypothetical protein
MLPPLPPKEMIVLLRKAGVAGKIYKNLTSVFSGFEEWLLDASVFEHFLLVDCWRHMNSQADSESSDKLLNPYTGNRFHRIALGKGLVGGIRFWCDGNDKYGYDFGYRFRIEAQKEADDDTRRRTREDAERVGEEMEALEELTFDVAEPPKVKVAEVIKLTESF